MSPRSPRSHLLIGVLATAFVAVSARAEPPEPDRDKDRIPDSRDRCPDDPETYNGVDDGDGCPDVGPVVRIVDRVEIEDRIAFARQSAALASTAGAALDRVAAVLKSTPRVRTIEVQGHCERAEKPALAVARANAVTEALVARGVASGRLVARGYGATRPACTERNRECQARNRRVEFVFLEVAR